MNIIIKELKKNIHTIQKHKALSKADGIICVSESTKSDLLKLYPALNKKPIKVIYHGVCNGYKIIDHADSRSYIAQKYALKNPFMLYVGGRTAAYKNFKLAVECVKNNTKYTLVIIGGGNLTRRELIFLEKELKGKYTHLQYISEKELNFFYNTAHCLLYLSSYEGFGLPLIEAQKAGCPIVAFNNSSIPEIATHHLSLLNTLSRDAVTQKIKALENDNYRQQEVNAGLLKSQYFCWDKCYKETIEFYKEVYKNNIYKKY